MWLGFTQTVTVSCATLWWSLSEILITPMPCMFVDVTWIHSVGKLCSYVHFGDHYLNSLLHPCLMCLWMWLGFTWDVSCAHMYTLVIITWNPYYTHMPYVFVDVTSIHSGGKLCSYVHSVDYYSKFLLHPYLMCLWMWLGFTQEVSCAHMYTLVIITRNPYYIDGLCIHGCDLDSLSV